MMRPNFTPFLFLFILASCAKSDLPAPGISEPVAEITQSHIDDPIVTGWEAPSGWNRSTPGDGTVTYSAKRSFPGKAALLSGDGSLLVYARGYNLGVSLPDKPLSLPFDFYLSANDGEAPLHWHYSAEGSELTVSVSLPAASEQQFKANQSGLRFRYIVLPPRQLETLKRSPEALRAMTYRDVAARLSIAP
jgi:hypothetical protein